MGFEINCQSRRKNTGIEKLCQDIGPIAGYILTPPDFSITEEEAKDIATWQNFIKADRDERIYPFPAVFSHTDNSEDTVFESGALGDLFIRNGKYNWQFTHESSRYKNEALKSHSLQSVGVVFIDLQGRLHGIRDVDGVTFKAVPLQQFVVERPTQNDGSSTAFKSRITMIFNGQDFESLPAVVIPDFAPLDLTGLTDVNLSIVGTPTDSEIQVMITAAYSGEPFTGVLDDFELKDASGNIETINSLTVDDGLHTLSVTGLSGDYTLDLKAPADMTTEGFESTGPVEFSI